MKAFPIAVVSSLAIVLGAVGMVRAQGQFDPQVSPTSFRLINAPPPAAPATAAVNDSGCQTGCDVDCDTWEPAPWKFSADAVFMHRSSPTSLPLIRTDWLHAGDVAYDAHQLDFGFSGGWRVGALRHGQDWDLEINYFQLDGVNANDIVPGSLYMVTDMDGAQLSIVAPWLEYRSRLYSAEFNIRAPRNEWLTLLAGFRYVELDETYKVAGNGDIVEVPVGFTEKTGNHMYGWQVGADGLLLRRGRLSIEGLAKAGIYWNHADQSALQFDTAPAGDTYTARAGDNTVAFLGELGLTGKYQVNERLAIRAGYQLMWLDGVATATDQITVNHFAIGGGPPSAGVEHTNTVFYHGALVGAEMTW